MKSGKSRFLQRIFALRFGVLCIVFANLCIVSVAQPPEPSEECLAAMRQCETSTDCIHRLAALQASCVTNTCQPQCRESAMNLFQNREGRFLLRSDASCVPGRHELEKCGFLPSKATKHCSFAKLICEGELECNSKWEVFVSECETETSEGRCSDKCRKHLNETISTSMGKTFLSCTCTDKDDNRCTQLRDITLKTCLKPTKKTSRPPFNPQKPFTSKESENEDNKYRAEGDEYRKEVPDSASFTATNVFFVLSMSCMLFAVAHTCLFFQPLSN